MSVTLCLLFRLFSIFKCFAYCTHCKYTLPLAHMSLRRSVSNVYTLKLVIKTLILISIFLIAKKTKRKCQFAPSNADDDDDDAAALAMRKQRRRVAGRWHSQNPALCRHRRRHSRALDLRAAARRCCRSNRAQKRM